MDGELNGLLCTRSRVVIRLSPSAMSGCSACIVACGHVGFELQNFVFEILLSERVRYMCAAFILASCEARQDVGIPNGHRQRPHPIRKKSTKTLYAKSLTPQG